MEVSFRIAKKPTSSSMFAAASCTLRHAFTFSGRSNHLVGPADEVQVVAVQKLADDICPEGEGDAAVVFSPTLHVFVGVGPQQVTQEA